MAVHYSSSTKGFYHSSIPYTDLPKDLVEVNEKEHLKIVELINNQTKEVSIVNGKFTLIDKVPVGPTWENIRHKRNLLLKESDFSQLPDFPEAKRAPWTKYRQILRDIPTLYKTPEEVEWPVLPE